MTQDNTEAETAPPRDLMVVGIGGSAGSLEALQELLDALPETTGAAFVIITHHPTDHASLLPDLLAQRTSLPVAVAEEGQALEADRIYIALPHAEHQWVLQDGCLQQRLSGFRGPGRAGAEESRTPVHHSVDVFFRSLADDAGNRAVGVVLSGTGTDGTLGLKAIKSHAGMVMAQDPSSADFDGMPTSATATGLVDYIVRPSDMPTTLLAYIEARQRRVAEPQGAPLEVSEGTLREIFDLVHWRTGHDFSGYKRSTLLRRLDRRLSLHRIETPADYVDFLHRDPAELDLLFKEVIISVTNFFRDPDAWQALADGPLPDQLRAASPERGFRAWVIGCATGEEAYTLAILLSECLDHLERPPSIQVFATDVDTEAIEVARTGRYPAGIAEDVSPQRLARFFVAEEDTFRVTKELRDKVVFAEHNVLHDPPFTRMDMVTCRNLLIYLERDLQNKLFPLFHYSLRTGGLLFLGTSESVDDEDAFETVDKHWRIFRDQQDPGGSRLPDLPRSHHGPAAWGGASWQAVEGERPNDLTRGAERLLAGRFAPPSVLVNNRGEVVYIHGRTGLYLEPAAGPSQNQFLGMARSGLRAPLGQLLAASASRDSGEMARLAHVQTNGHFETIEVRVQRIETPRTLKGLRLFSFHPAAAEAPGGGEQAPASPAEGEPAAEVTRLQRDLETVRQDKQITVEELQASNEELQSMNEELQSMNEELQSSNEELEVAKEEVESLNEELRTVNAELESKVEELSAANDDMNNLLNSTDVATLFLDEDLNVKRFTEAARDLVALRPSDEGRPITELATYLEYDDLVADAEEVLTTLRPKEVEVRTRDGQWYILRIMPYRTTQGVISGLVCTFRDIQQTKRLEASEAFVRHIVQTAREPLLVLDDHQRVRTANDGFYHLSGLNQGEVEGKPLFDLDHGRWDRAELHTLLEEVLPNSDNVTDYPVATDAGRVRINACKLRTEAGDTGLVMLALAASPPSTGEGH